jgi:hypothetical protein
MIKEMTIHKCHQGTFGIRSDIVELVKRKKGTLVVYLEDKKTTRTINWDKLDDEKLQEMPGQASKFGHPYKLWMFNCRDFSKYYEQLRLI